MADAGGSKGGIVTSSIFFQGSSVMNITIHGQVYLVRTEADVLALCARFSSQAA